MNRSASAASSCPLRGILTATTVSSWVSLAFHTEPKAPTPNCSISSKWAMRRRMRACPAIERSTGTPRSIRLILLPHDGQFISTSGSWSMISTALWQCGQWILKAKG